MNSVTRPAEPEPARAELHEDDPGVTRRVVVLSIALAVFFGYFSPIIDAKLANTFLGAQHLPPGAIAALLLVLAVNPLLRLVSRRLAFRRNEALTVYITCLFSCLVPGHGAENFFVPNLVAPFYFATRENGWVETIQPWMPRWMSPALWAEGDGTYGPLGRAAVEGWYVGGVPVPWAAWLVPCLAWGALIVALYVMLGCLSVMLRAQWAENEALAFPLLRLPLEMTEHLDDNGASQKPSHNPGHKPSFFGNPLLRIGVGIAVFVQMMNGLHLYFPDVPAVVTELDTGALLSEPPWNQIGWTPLQIYPIAIGLSFLLTSEVSFSLWFFFWCVRLQLIAAYYTGFMPGTLPEALGAWGKVFLGYQQIGAFVAYAALVMWVGREHFAHIARRAFGRARARPSERDEVFSYPTAFWGFALSSAFLLAWSVTAGIRLDVAVAMWALYLAIAIGLTRVVVEGGLLFVSQGWTPLGAMAQLVGAGPGTWLPAQSVVPAAFLQSSIMNDTRGFLLPSFVQGFKLAHDRGIRKKPLLALIATVIAITLVMGVYMNVRMGYDTGALGFGHRHFSERGSRLPAEWSKSMIGGVRDVSWSNWLWLGVGMSATWAMMVARARLLWFPLHPIGYLMTLTYPMHTLWFSILVGWAAKVLITRFAGGDSYRKAVPFFLGLALGDIVMMLFWLLIDGWQGRSYHYLVPT